MKTRFAIVAIVLAVCILFTGALALATDFVWGCPGPLCAPASWTEQSSWDQGVGFPDGTDDNATIDDPSGESTCTYDSETALTIGNMTLAGDSPTRMTLHVRDQTLEVDDFFFEDYGRIDADKNFTSAGPNDISDDIWIDVADNTTVDLGGITDVVGTSASLHLVTGDNSSCDLSDLKIRSVIPGQSTVNRTFKLTGVSAAGGDLYVGSCLDLISNLGSGASEWAKLWVGAGSITIERLLDIGGGDSATSAARIDVDGALTSTTATEMDGYVKVDVASGKTFDTGKLEVHTGAILTKTGTGTLQSS